MGHDSNAVVPHQHPGNDIETLEDGTTYHIGPSKRVHHTLSMKAKATTHHNVDTNREIIVQSTSDILTLRVKLCCAEEHNDEVA